MPTEIPNFSVTLSRLDYAVIAVYFAVLIAMGALLRKRAGTDMESYFLAGRKMPGWLNGFSYAATCMNADVAPAYCGMTVITGTFICWWYMSRFGLALMVGAMLFAIFWRRLALFTSPEFYELRFSGRPAITIRSWVALRSTFIAVVAWTGAGLLGMHKVAQPMLGWSIWTTFAVVIPIILFYVLLSGYIGVVFSDFFEGLVVIAKSLLLCWLVLADFGGPTGLGQALISAYGESAVSWHPPSHHELLGMMGVLTWGIGTFIGYGGDAAPMSGAMEGQRILSCKNAREASKMYVWTQVILFFMLLVLTLPALGAMVRWPGLSDGTINKELAYGMMLAHYLPPGILGIAVSAILASIMGTVSSNMNFGAQVFVNDVYKRSLVKNATPKYYLFVGRIVATAIVLLAIGVATVATNVIDISVFMLGLSAAELTANWAQWWWWRFNGKARLAASFGGPLLYLLNHFLFLRSTPYEPIIPQSLFEGFAAMLSELIAFKSAFFEQLFPPFIRSLDDGTYSIVLISMAETLVLWVIVALLTKPEPEEVLVEFYKRARPMGWWGPIARKAGVPALQGGKPIASGLAIAAIGAVMVGAGTIAVSQFYVGRHEIGIAALIVAGVFGVCFKLSYNWFMNKLQVD